MNQCHMLTCRYNINTNCVSKDNYKVCTDAVIGVFGKERYEEFLKWEQLEIIRKQRKNK